MTWAGLLSAWSHFYSAQDPSHDGVHRVALLRFRSQRVVGQAHRGDVLRAHQLPRRVREVADVRRNEVTHARLAWERQAGGPVVLDKLQRQLRQEAAATAQVDPRRQALAAGQLPDAEREALKKDFGVGAEQLRHLAVLVR